MEFRCPHCKSSKSLATRVQGPDDLQYQTDVSHIRELWQCMECDEYFFIEFELSNIIPLVVKE